MRGEGTERHLTADEIVERVFPSGDRPVAVPENLSTCSPCQARVAQLREAWLLDRGAVAGVVDSLPESFWESQVEAVSRSVAENDPSRAVETGLPTGRVRLFPSASRRILRHPVLAAGSLAAALLLVAGITVGRLHKATEVAQQVPTARPSLSPADKADDELLRSVDRLLREDSPVSSLVPEDSL